METTLKPKHIGRNISRIRELRQMKQEALAMAIGVSQQTISTIENSETVDDEKLQQIAVALGVSAEGIKNFNEENLITYFNTFNESDFSNSNGAFGNHNNYNFNPIDKLIEVYEEKEKLYERLLQAEKDKLGYLEKLLNK
jgi:transcriptional regulator with XRE-family HTH domain